MKIFLQIVFLFFLSWYPVAADPLYGRENLAAFYTALVKARADGTPIRIHVVGDSKVEGYGVAPGYRIDELLAEGARGYPVIVTYEGWSGQNSFIWAHEKAAKFIAEKPSTNLLIVDFGTNERILQATGGRQTTEQTIANHLAAIATIRAVRGPSEMSILLMGQPPANNWNPDYDQTLARMTEINGALRNVAQQTNSGFFDPLELFQRAHAEAGWMDQLPAPEFGDGNAHPGNAMNMVMVGELSSRLFPMPFVSRARRFSCWFFCGSKP